MTVSLTVSESFGGAQLSDVLAGGSSGVDLGSVTNGSYSGVVSRTDNTGGQSLYIRHDAVIDNINGLKIFIDIFTGTYGGARTAAADIAALISMGQTSGSSRNNADGNSSGIWLDQDRTISLASAGNNAFNFAANGIGQAGNGTVAIFGDNGTDGISQLSAFTILAEAMCYDNSGETTPSAPQDGKVGVSGDTVLGDQAHIRSRAYLASAFAEGGIYQWDYVFLYEFTA